jgi:hypothetical protein
MDAQLARWQSLFGKDTGTYTVRHLKGNDVGRTLYTGKHVDCLNFMRRCLRFDKRWNANTITLINESTGRHMSWCI